MAKKQILLTNDDGIRSPGLWAAAKALSALGFVTVAAPREQCSGMGRSLPGASTGIIEIETVTIGGQDWLVHSVGGSPAQSVLHGIFEILPTPPDLVVSGINYGENMGTGITISGTVGAAMEGAAMGIPALAMSLQTDKEHHTSYSLDVDFSAAAHFTAKFAQLILENGLPPAVNLLKVDVPADATPATPWHWTRLSRQPYFVPVPAARSSLSEPGRMGYAERVDLENEPQDTDIYAMRVLRKVSVTPLTLDFTARIGLDEMKRWEG